MIGLVPFLGIAIQNAYMLTVMNVTEVQNHTFAHIALFIGAGMFILWDTIFSITVVSVALAANIVLFSINSDLSFNEVLMNGGLLTTSVALFSIVLIYTRTNLTRKTIYAQLALAESNLELEMKNELIEIKSDKKAIGGINEIGQDKVFNNHTFQLEKNDCIYLFTDGFADQFGGEKGKKLKYKLFQDLLIESSDFSMKEQQQNLQGFFENWKGEFDQIDDVLVIGVRI
jgi:hypothetical protein